MKKIIFAITVLTLLSNSYLYAAGAGAGGGGGGVDIQKFMQETQRLYQEAKSFRLIWWIPTEYWEESFRNAPNMTDSQKEAFYHAVNNYIVFAVIDAKISELGSILPSSRDDIVNKLSLSIGQGKMMKPLSDNEINSDARNLFAMMKPLVANMLGQFGQGMEFISFEGSNSFGERFLDPKENASFSVKLGDKISKWRLPLGCLLPTKYDQQTKEEFPGNYLYNPFTGNQLVVK